MYDSQFLLATIVVALLLVILVILVFHKLEGGVVIVRFERNKWDIEYYAPLDGGTDPSIDIREESQKYVDEG